MGQLHDSFPLACTLLYSLQFIVYILIRRMREESEILKKKERVSLLFLSYGGLLTAKVRRRIEYVYLMDYSLSEVAENENVSRNAIFESIEAGVKKLELFEKKLGLCKKNDKIIAMIDHAKEIQDKEELMQYLEKIKGELSYGV